MEDVLEQSLRGGVLLVILVSGVDSGLDKAGVPSVQVSSDDVGLGVVSDHVDVLGKNLLGVDLLHPAGENLVGIGVGGTLGLSVDGTLQLDTGDGLVHSLESEAEGSLGHTGEGVLGGAQIIALGEVDGDSLGDGVLGTGSETSVLRLKKIHDDLVVGGVVAGVREDQDSVDVSVVEVSGSGGGTLPRSKDTVRSNGLIPGNNVVGDNNILESVKLSDLTASEALTTDNEDGVVVLGQSRHGSVGLDELLGRDWRSEDFGELCATLLLGLSGTVGEENVGNLTRVSECL
jgi:hypothetical protein